MVAPHHTIVWVSAVYKLQLKQWSRTLIFLLLQFWQPVLDLTVERRDPFPGSAGVMMKKPPRENVRSRLVFARIDCGTSQGVSCVKWSPRVVLILGARLGLIRLADEKNVSNDIMNLSAPLICSTMGLHPEGFSC